MFTAVFQQGRINSLRGTKLLEAMTMYHVYDPLCVCGLWPDVFNSPVLFPDRREWPRAQEEMREQRAQMEDLETSVNGPLCLFSKTKCDFLKICAPKKKKKKVLLFSW